MIPYSLEIGIPSLVNILDRETYDLAEEWSHLQLNEQLERITDLRILVKTIKQLTDATA